MDDPSLRRVHRVQGHVPSVLADTAAVLAGNVLEGALALLAVVTDVDGNADRLAVFLTAVGSKAGEVLDGVQGLAAAADEQRIVVLGGHFEEVFFACLRHIDLIVLDAEAFNDGLQVRIRLLDLLRSFLHGNGFAGFRRFLGSLLGFLGRCTLLLFCSLFFFRSCCLLLLLVGGFLSLLLSLRLRVAGALLDSGYFRFLFLGLIEGADFGLFAAEKTKLFLFGELQDFELDVCVFGGIQRTDGRLLCFLNGSTGRDCIFYHAFSFLLTSGFSGWDLKRAAAVGVEVEAAAVFS